jgi:hypothetical protein
MARRRAWSQQDVIREIYRVAPKYGADPRLMVAVARVESGLRPSAVGDQGTSFGLFQHHVGGAGGSSLGSARRYLDPAVSIENSARRFAGARTPADAFGVQRPADRASYIRKLQQALRSGSAALNAPIEGSGPVSAGIAGERPQSASGGLSPVQASLVGGLFRESPLLQGLLAQSLTRSTPAGAVAPESSEPSGPVARSWRELQRIAQQRFGLRNDPGSSQTTGGRHTAGSEHYAGRAIDFGDARNDPRDLRRWMNWAKRQGYDVLWEGDHVHVSLPGRGI